MTLGPDIILWVSQKIIKDHFIDFFCPFMCHVISLYQVISLCPVPQEYASSQNIGLQLCQSLTGHSHNFCAIFTPAHLVGTMNCRSKGLWLIRVPILSLKVLPGHRRLKLRLFISYSRSLSYDHPLRFLGIFIVLGFLAHPRDAIRFKVPLSMLFRSSSPHKIPPVSITIPLSSPHFHWQSLCYIFFIWDSCIA